MSYQRTAIFDFEEIPLLSHQNGGGNTANTKYCIDVEEAELLATAGKSVS